ncbi:MAG: hypothetical protein IKW68_00700, partial [Clostridia bacterium]|nr:hypothetical protein [Clostridia bacterium]
MSRHFNFSCDKFLGLNYDRSCENNLLSGESPEMVNFTVTEAYKLKKRRGYMVLDRMDGEGRGMWCGELGGKETTIFVVGEKVFTRNSDGDAVETGKLESTSGQVDFLRFSNKLYLLDGVKIKLWDGNILSDIT